MTWAEAKAKMGETKPKAGTSLKLGKNETHGKLLANKLLAKHGPTAEQQTENRQAAKQARKDAQRAAALQERREAEKEKAKMDDVVQPWQQAQDKMQQVALALAEGKGGDMTINNLAEQSPSPDQWEMICDSKQMQYDEWMALQAIYQDGDNDEDDETASRKLRLVQDSCTIPDLKSVLEAWQGNRDNETLQKAVVDLPPLSFTLALTFEDDLALTTHDPPLVACLLLHVTFPSLYPEVTRLRVAEAYFLATDPTLVVPSNKPLASLARLQTDEFVQAMHLYLQEELLGMPSVYELASTWLLEHFWEYVIVD